MRIATAKLTATLCGLALAACSGFPSSADTAAAPDTIFFNGKIVTVDEKFSIAEAVAIRDGRFVAVGGNDRIRRLAQGSTRSSRASQVSLWCPTTIGTRRS